MSLIVYYTDLGQLTFSCTSDKESDLEPNCVLVPESIQAQELEEYYFDIGAQALTKKLTDVCCVPDSNTGVVGQVIVIKNIPANTTVVWPDAHLSVESGQISFDASHAGKYSFWFSPITHKDTEHHFEITS